MILAANLPTAILDTILGRLALLFLSGAAGDTLAARNAARQMLAAYQPETEDELRLAAEITSFSFHALEALGQAADPDISLNQKLRLRGSAVSLSRESHKSQRKLDLLQKARRAGTIATQPVEAPTRQPEPVPPGIEKALALIEATRDALATKNAGEAKTWTQAYRQRQATQRITENLRKNQARASQSIAQAASLPATQSPHA